MPTSRFIWVAVFFSLLRLSICAGRGEISSDFDSRHQSRPNGLDVVRQPPSQGQSPRYLLARSPKPQGACYTCENVNGETGCVPQDASCCPAGGYCANGRFCCYGKCISIQTDECCNTPGGMCLDGWGCYIRTYRSRSSSFEYPTCCYDSSCDNERPLFIAEGYDTPRRPQSTTAAEVVYRTYSRTVTWTYWYTYYIYIEVRTTTSLTSERVTTTRIISVSATAAAEAEAELDASAVVLSQETPPQPTTEVRGQIPPSTSAEPEPTPVDPEPTTPPEVPRPTITRTPESDPSESNTPSSTTRRRTTSVITEDVPTSTGTRGGGSAAGGGSAGVGRFEQLSGVGGWVVVVTVSFTLVVMLF